MSPSESTGLVAFCLWVAPENLERVRLVWNSRGARHPAAGVRLEARVARFLNWACIGTRRLLGALRDEGVRVVYLQAKGKVSASARAMVVSVRIFQ